MPKNLLISPLRGGDGSGGRLRTSLWTHELSYPLRISRPRRACRIRAFTYVLRNLCHKESPWLIKFLYSSRRPRSTKILINKKLIMKVNTKSYSRTGRSQIGSLTYLLSITFPLLANDEAKPPSPATHRATYLVINKEKESHARGGHAEKLIE